jgi:hypothetical protein
MSNPMSRPSSLRSFFWFPVLVLVAVLVSGCSDSTATSEDLPDTASPADTFVEDTSPADTSPVDTSATEVDISPEDTFLPPDTFTPPPDTFTPPPDTFTPPPDTSADADSTSGPLDDLLCISNADHSRTQGQECGCDNDCDASAPLCRRDLRQDLLGISYCTDVCQSDNDCATGFGCLSELAIIPIPGLEPFCRRCATPTPGSLQPGDDCICGRDCGGSGFRPGLCYQGQCALQGCADGIFTCPSGSECDRPLDQPLGVCLTCLQSTPQPEGADCKCSTDCASPTECKEGTCRALCTDASQCGPDQECREQLNGDRWCEDKPLLCFSTSLPLGTPCVCDANCGSEAPICLRQNIAGINVSICTRRPCDRSDSASCATSGINLANARCCELPLVMPSTCLPSLVIDQIGIGALLCSP